MSDLINLKDLVPELAGNPVLRLLPASEGDIALALTANDKFPDREIRLGGAAFAVETDKVSFPLPQGASVSFGVKGTVPALGVFDTAATLLAGLPLIDSEVIGLQLEDRPGQRYLLWNWDYSASGSLKGSHPIGALGSVSFGVEAQRGAAYAVIQRFDKGEGARDVLIRALKSWRLPRFVRDATSLQPGAMVLAEIEGELAVNLAAQLGYDFTFVREVQKFGLSGNIGLKLESGLKASLGFSVSGRYVVAVERVADTSVRVRLYKLSKKGWNFALNLNASVQGDTDAFPKDPDDIVKAVFNVHGLQVLKEIEEWTDPDKQLSKLVADLADDRLNGLIENKIGDTIARWKTLSDRVKSTVWKQIESGISGAQKREITETLRALSGADNDAKKKLLEKLLSRVDLPGTPVGQILEAMAEKGLLSLLDRLGGVQDVAQSILYVIDGPVLENIQKQVKSLLDLNLLGSAETGGDPGIVNAWLKSRLETFLEKKLDTIPALQEARSTVHAVMEKRKEIYKKAIDAMSRRYDFDIAAKWSATTEKTALIDATFDTSDAGAKRILGEVLGERNYDGLFTHQTGAVTLSKGVLTHGLNRRSSVDIRMPFYQSSTTSLTQSLAKVTAEEENGRVLFYELDASDQRTVKNRLSSEFSVSLATRVRPGDAVFVGDASSAETGYQLRLVRVDATLGVMYGTLKPFVDNYLAPQFSKPGAAPFETWLMDLDRRVEEVVSNGINEFGDVLISEEVTLPAEALLAWFRPRSKDELKCDILAVSKRLQGVFKRLFLEDWGSLLERFKNIDTARAALAYASIAPMTHVELQGARLVETGRGAYWTTRNPEILEAALLSSETQLALLLTPLEQRLRNAGLTGTADMFRPCEAGSILRSCLKAPAKHLLDSLLSAEENLVNSAEAALEQASKAADKNLLEKEPSKAIQAMAEAGAKMTVTFHKRMQNLYGGDRLRPFGAMTMLEASRVLDPSLAAVRPKAMLTLTVLQETRKFNPLDFLAGKNPKEEDVAVPQRLVSAG